MPARTEEGIESQNCGHWDEKFSRYLQGKERGNLLSKSTFDTPMGLVASLILGIFSTSEVAIFLVDKYRKY